ncbi:MAG TPA: alpha/beta hydrolase [Actinotalea caeni]|uniref:alpha/beta hydrolase n=1 Tax=Actinotalea caeni TaxID=1348467 RepID=UPI0012E2F269|nr:alpha/beta hydrolase [Actinotalea caeni]HLV56055.1 alpha/beta hydrolase [Actinotalea caeni]
MTWSEPRPDVLDGWVARTLELEPDAHGRGVATLVHRPDAGSRPRAMVYLHGFVDYFFQTHHAEEWAAHGYDVYALDLRDYGRSIRPGRTPNWITDLRDYDEEIDAALALVRAQGHDVVVLDGHSTGGLIASLYVHDHPGSVDALVLNSPWFDLNASWFDRVVSTRVIDRLGVWRPTAQVASLGEPYGRSLHTSTGGEWDYDLAWKPHEGFPVLAGWLRAIRRGHARLARGLAITVPVLVATSGRSGHRKRPTPQDLAGSDVVLDVRHMWARAPLLGPHVRVLRVPGGRHDLTLSEPPVRQRYSALLFDWLERALP